MIMDGQHWYCEFCEVKGFVVYQKGKGLMSMIQKISQQHKNKSPKCTKGMSQIRCPQKKAV
jgi:hypothetical protein